MAKCSVKHSTNKMSNRNNTKTLARDADNVTATDWHITLHKAPNASLIPVNGQRRVSQYSRAAVNFFDELLIQRNYVACVLELKRKLRRAISRWQVCRNYTGNCQRFSDYSLNSWWQHTCSRGYSPSIHFIYSTSHIFIFTNSLHVRWLPSHRFSVLHSLAADFGLRR